MTNWFFSKKGAITLSILALLSEAWRGFLDAVFVMDEVTGGDKFMLNMAAIIFTALFAYWAWLLVRYHQGSQKALSGLFILNAVVVLIIPVGWLLFFCPASCRVDAHIFNLANTLNLIFGVLAGISLWGELRKSFKQSATANA